MRAKIQIGRILFFTDVLSSNNILDQESVKKTVSDYQYHYGIDYVVYVINPDCGVQPKVEIIIRSTSNQIPDIEIIESDMYLGLRSNFLFHGEVEGTMRAIDYTVSRLREIILTLGQVEEIPKDAKVSYIEPTIRHYSYVRAEFDRFDDYFGFDEYFTDYDEAY